MGDCSIFVENVQGLSPIQFLSISTFPWRIIHAWSGKKKWHNRWQTTGVKQGWVWKRSLSLSNATRSFHQWQKHGLKGRSQWPCQQKATSTISELGRENRGIVRLKAMEKQLMGAGSRGQHGSDRSIQTSHPDIPARNYYTGDQHMQPSISATQLFSLLLWIKPLFLQLNIT